MKALFLLALVILCAACQSCEKSPEPQPLARACRPDFSPALNADGLAPNDAKITIYKADAPVIFVHNGTSTVVPIDSMPRSVYVRAGDAYRIETSSWADIRFEDCLTL